MNITYAATLCLLIILSFTLTPINKVFACSQSGGKTQKDEKVAEKMCSVFKDIPDILMMSVNESILYVDVSRGFYNEMKQDKISGTKFVKKLMTGMRQETGRKSVTVWIYTDKEKVIEGDTTITGGDEVEYLF